MIEMKKQGQHSFMVVVAEGMGSEFGEKLVSEIEKNTGIETRFIRPAHIVRGGIPTLRDRSLASAMGDKAVDMLLDGKSDLVICSRNDKITTTDIKYALIVDRMFKNKLKEHDLDKFSAEEIESMKALCAERRAYFEDMYNIMLTIGC